MNSPEPNNAPPLAQTSIDAKVADAASWCVALGVVSFIAALFQLFGVVDPGVPVWINLAVPVALIGLGAALDRQSILAAGILSALFLAMVVNTLLVTGAYFSQGGFLTTAIMVVRYLILINAARAVGQAFFGMVEYRRTAVKGDALAPAYEAGPPSATAQHASTDGMQAPRPELKRGVNGAAVYFVFLTAMMIMLFVIMIAVPAFEDLPAFIKLVPLILAGGAGYIAQLENKFLPEKAGELRMALKNEDAEVIAKLSELFKSKGRRASRALAREALSEAAAHDAPFHVMALKLIGEIGILEQDAARAIYADFIENTSDESVRAEARACLKAIGYNIPAQTIDA